MKFIGLNFAYVILLFIAFLMIVMIVIDIDNDCVKDLRLKLSELISNIQVNTLLWNTLYERSPKGKSRWVKSRDPVTWLGCEHLSFLPIMH